MRQCGVYTYIYIYMYMYEIKLSVNIFMSISVLVSEFFCLAPFSFAYNQLPHKCLAYITALRLKGKTHTKLVCQHKFMYINLLIYVCMYV